ncbi:tetratricopeptide repeat protein [uncultured Microscilla sp.]|uniref:tetratricopeptide repeat protein n=1 Tax=uncultured Microscilla sp. TaxID=432653 RepID=UPI002611ECA6|nr:tetratricopeptide repeat protein [uncultured Microscilla sp.]
MNPQDYLKNDQNAIIQIKQLIESGRKENVALALGLIKGGGMVPALVTHLCAILLIYHDDAVIKNAAVKLYKLPLAFRYYGGLVYNDDTINRMLAIAEDYPDIDASLLVKLIFEQTGKMAAYCLENRLVPAQQVIAQQVKGDLLNLSQMKLSFLPSEIGLFPQIKHLNIEGNLFDSLPDELQNLKQLEHIYFDDTPLNVESIKQLEGFFPKAMAEYYAEKGTMIMYANTNVWNDYKEALHYLTKATLLDTSDAYYLIEQATILRKMRKHQQAIDILDKALALYKTNASSGKYKEQGIYNDQGISYIRLGKYAKAHQVYNKALHIDPKYGNAWYNQACAYAQQQNKEKMLYCLARAIYLRNFFKVEAKKDADFADFYKDFDFMQLVSK